MVSNQCRLAYCVLSCRKEILVYSTCVDVDQKVTGSNSVQSLKVVCLKAPKAHWNHYWFEIPLKSQFLMKFRQSNLIVNVITTTRLLLLCLDILMVKNLHICGP